ncbi:hypothetical protein ACN38_g9254 [Penicillium nordicum]|uniref:Uncharacterized protein n=1 Tax=Penicillium nordicum TaxID=229535 RepID=A0A0M9WCQ9_9EURO|nr:hypothetical protein ACN38_g9254 [Penicillium nordicum]
MDASRCCIRSTHNRGQYSFDEKDESNSHAHYAKYTYTATYEEHEPRFGATIIEKYGWALARRGSGIRRRPNTSWRLSSTTCSVVVPVGSGKIILNAISEWSNQTRGLGGTSRCR